MNDCRVVRILTGLALIGLSTPAARGADEPSWTTGPFGIAGIDHTIHAAIEFDEGDHKTLIVGGQFNHAGMAFANHIARWDGTEWSTMGDGFNSPVQALALYDSDGDGPEKAALYAAGDFGSSGQTVLGRTARWNGTTWENIGLIQGGSPPTVHAMTVIDFDGPGSQLPYLVIGGWFSGIASETTGCVARYDGANWSALGTIDGRVTAMAVIDFDGNGPDLPMLVVGGSFNIGSGSQTKVAAWDGSNWILLGSTFSGGSVEALGTHDPDGDGPV